MSRSPLSVLTTAALALPAFAATQPTDTTIAIKASQYEEDSLSEGDILLGSNDRYDIDVYQFQLTTPIGRDWALGINASREIMSGASPWGTTRDFNGANTLIMSGATIRDARTETSLTVSRYFSDSSAFATLSHSDEDDYRANAITLGVDWDFNNKLSTLAVAASYSDDKIEPSEAVEFGRVARADKRSRSLSVSWTQILNSTSLAQVGASLTKRDGFLSDPYKLRDVRPDDRIERTLSLRYRKYLSVPNAALHLNYRFFNDSFDVTSHTLDVSWHQTLHENFKLIPTVRYYSQEEADFYLSVDNFALPITQNQSSDFRLSSYGAWSFGLKGVLQVDQWSIDVAVERYISDEDYGIDDPDEGHPALLEFNLVTLGVQYRF